MMTTPETPLKQLAIPKPRCKLCGSDNTRQGPGAGPHYARLLCNNCGAFVKWLPRPWEPRIVVPARPEAAEDKY